MQPNRNKFMNRTPPPGPSLTWVRSSIPFRRTDRAGSVAHGARTEQMAGAEDTGDKSSTPAMDHFVSHTALLVCAHRVHESRRRDALFKDPVAEVMVPEVRGRSILSLVCMCMSVCPIPSPPCRRWTPQGAGGINRKKEALLCACMHPTTIRADQPTDPKCPTSTDVHEGYCGGGERQLAHPLGARQGHPRGRHRRAASLLRRADPAAPLCVAVSGPCLCWGFHFWRYGSIDIRLFR